MWVQIWYFAHFESLNRGRCKCVTSAPQVFQIWSETGFLVCWPLSCHSNTYFTLGGHAWTLLLARCGRKDLCTDRFIKCIILTTVMGTESLVLAEVVAMSFIAYICKRTFKKWRNIKFEVWKKCINKQNMHLPQKKYHIYKPYHDKAWKSNLYQSYNCPLLPQMCRSPCELQPDLLIVVSAPIAVSWHPALCCVDFQSQIFELQSSTLWTSAGCPDPLQQKKRMVNPLLTYIQSSIRVYTPKSLKLLFKF